MRYCRRRRERQHRDVPIVIRHRLRLRQRGLEAPRAFDVGLGPDDLLHGQLGRDPRPAAAAPAGVVVHVHLQPQPVRLGADMLEQLAPQRPAEPRRAFRRALVHLHDQHAADAHALHRLQVGGDAVAGDVAVQREPIDPRPGGVGRLEEAFFQSSTWWGGVAGRGQREGEQEEVNLFHISSYWVVHDKSRCAHPRTQLAAHAKRRRCCLAISNRRAETGGERPKGQVRSLGCEKMTRDDQR